MTDFHYRCALIHYHRPELLNYHGLHKNDKRNNTELAFKVAEEKLGIPVRFGSNVYIVIS